MPIRTVKQHTDRGKIKDLAKPGEVIEPEIVPSSTELRMKKLYEYAQLNKDHELQSALGFITTDYISDKNALPLSVYRIRQMVDDIKSKSAGKIDRLSEELLQYFGDGPSPLVKEYLNQKHARIKTASVRKPPSFWRASRS
jgi:hypothetical protein